MTVFYSLETGGFYPEEFLELYKEAGTLPSDVKEITQEQYDEFREALSKGGKIVPNRGDLKIVYPVSGADSSLEPLERQWRDEQLRMADIELSKVQDSDPKARGTVADWRQYRKELRAWPEHKDFPRKESRPVSP